MAEHLIQRWYEDDPAESKQRVTVMGRKFFLVIAGAQSLLDGCVSWLSVSSSTKIF